MLRDVLFSGGGWLVALCSFGVALLITRICHRVGTAIAQQPYCKSLPEHWVEKARLLYPVWLALAILPLFLAMIWLLGIPYDEHFVDSRLAKIINPVGALVLFTVGGMVSARIERGLRERAVTLADWLRTWAIALLLFIPNFVVFGVMMQLLPATLTREALLIIAFGIIAVAFFLGGGNFLLARIFRLLLPADARLQSIIESAAARLGIAPARTYILRWKAANAMAFPLLQRIAVTDTALATFSDEELVAICAHELGHLKESRWVTVGRLAGAFVFLPLFAVVPIMGSLGFPGFIAVFLAVFLGCRLVQRLGRAMEVRADAVGKTHEGDPGTYARALEKLHQVNLMPVVMRQKHLTHPHLYDRLLAAEITPAYPRPAPPPRWRSLAAFSTAVLLALLLTFIWRVILVSILG